VFYKRRNLDNSGLKELGKGKRREIEKKQPKGKERGKCQPRNKREARKGPVPGAK